MGACCLASDYSDYSSSSKDHRSAGVPHGCPSIQRPPGVGLHFSSKSEGASEGPGQTALRVNQLVAGGMREAGRTVAQVQAVLGPLGQAGVLGGGEEKGPRIWRWTEGGWTKRGDGNKGFYTAFLWGMSQST